MRVRTCLVRVHVLFVVLQLLWLKSPFHDLRSKLVSTRVVGALAPLLKSPLGLGLKPPRQSASGLLSPEAMENFNAVQKSVADFLRASDSARKKSSR